MTENYSCNRPHGGIRTFRWKIQAADRGPKEMK